MRAFRGIGRIIRVAFIGLAALALANDLAAAGERLLMSYDCRVEGRNLELVQSPPREYPILGPRQQEIHTACSPADQSRCRSWRIHRFDIDCGGARVAWLDVVGAVAFQQRYPARVKGDRMVIGMGRSWGTAAREPFSGPRMRYPGAGTPYGDGFGTPRAASGRVIELPPGFAPMLGIDARFIEAPTPATAKPVPPIDAATIALPLPNPARKDSASEGRSSAAIARTDAAKADLGKAETRATSDAGDRASPGYKILNPGGEADATASRHSRQLVAPAPPAAGSGGDEDRLAMLPAAPTPAAAPTLPSPAEAASTASTPESRRFTTIAGAAIGAAALAAIALAAFMVSRPRSSRVAVVPPEARDYGAISLGGDTGTRALVATRPGAIEPRLPTAPPSQPAPAAPAGTIGAQFAPPAPEAESVLNWLPETRAEALALLGAAPDAPIEVVKKIADGLRQSWHPDLANNELDRLVREKRTKQLNVAWDLITARSQAA
ncbi:MAG: hypothetical protein AB1749_03750 [Pseudomonadota bacterium]